MTLIEDWRAVLKKAWSVKFNILAAILGGLEVAIALIKPDGIPNGIFASVAGLTSVGAIGARLLAQKEVSNGSTK